MGLISTADLREWMAIEEGDKKPNAKLNSLAKMVEDYVESFTNRQLLAKTYYDNFDYSYIDGNGRSHIYLPVYPVSYVSDVNIDNDHDFASGTIVSSDSLFWYSSGKLVSKSGRFTHGRP